MAFGSHQVAHHVPATGKVADGFSLGHRAGPQDLGGLAAAQLVARHRAEDGPVFGAPKEHPSDQETENHPKA